MVRKIGKIRRNKVRIVGYKKVKIVSLYYAVLRKIVRIASLDHAILRKI